jgi:tetratricopeptide (TPR) repeat protein
MRSYALLGAALSLLVPLGLTAQVAEDELRSRVEAAYREDASVNTLLRGVAAARLLRDFDQAEELLDEAAGAVLQARNGLIANALLFQVESGGGINGMQRTFREARRVFRLTPLEMGNWVNGYPSLLVGGEFDEMIERFSPDAADPAYRCECYAQKAWMHRVAGRLEESQEYWGKLVAQWDADPPQIQNPNARANWQGQYARNLARAGRPDDARRALAEATAMEVGAGASPGVRRRWAQAYAELGDVDAAVEHLEALLGMPSLVSVHSLETRYTWEGIRDEPAFQAMLDRHR